MASYPSLNQKRKIAVHEEMLPLVFDLVFELENTNVQYVFKYVRGVTNGNLKILGDTVKLLI